MHFCVGLIPQIRLQKLMRDRKGDAYANRDCTAGLVCFNVIGSTHANACVAKDLIVNLALECCRQSMFSITSKAQTSILFQPLVKSCKFR